jgi:uncharacterized protein (TIGR02452 family)
MSRAERAALAEQTLAILEAGRYVLPDGRTVSIEREVARCLEGTRLFEPTELAALLARIRSRRRASADCSVEVENETTLAGIARLLREGGGPVAALNFASAINPGGTFLNGTQAQEESLARSSALHASLVTVPDFYERHRHDPHPLYTDAMILSPHCPIVRDDTGALLERVHEATFVTSAAPNAGLLRDGFPAEVPLIAEVFERRVAYVLALAASEGYRSIVLGAWGCGVFRNDPAVVAGIFRKHLRSARWRKQFDRVVFSIYESSPAHPTLDVFRQIRRR